METGGDVETGGGEGAETSERVQVASGWGAVSSLVPFETSRKSRPRGETLAKMAMAVSKVRMTAKSCMFDWVNTVWNLIKRDMGGMVLRVG